MSEERFAIGGALYVQYDYKTFIFNIIGTACEISANVLFVQSSGLGILHPDILASGSAGTISFG